MARTSRAAMRALPGLALLIAALAASLACAGDGDDQQPLAATATPMDRDADAARHAYADPTRV